MKIVQAPNDILSGGTKPVTDFGDSLQKIIADMSVTLEAQKDPQGVGLAAPQVGLDIALFIIKPSPEAKVETFVNPKIIKLSTSKIKPKTSNQKPRTKNKKTPLEGCLSIKRIWGPVKRAGKVLLEYQTPDGRKHSEWISGFRAVIVQHEVDHLQGILFTQRVLEQSGSLYEEQGDELVKLEY